MFVANYLVLLPDRITLTGTLWLNPWRVSHINTDTNQSAFFWETALQMGPGILLQPFIGQWLWQHWRRSQNWVLWTTGGPVGVVLKGFFKKPVVCHLCTVESCLLLPRYLHPNPWKTRRNKCSKGNQFSFQIPCSQVFLVLLLSLERWTAKCSTRIWLLLKCPLDLRF